MSVARFFSTLLDEDSFGAERVDTLMSRKMTEEQLKEREAARRKFWYYVEEMFVLFATVIGVLFSEYIARRARGEDILAFNISVGWPNLLISRILALSYYGGAYTKFKYNATDLRPPFIKRLATALMSGMAIKSTMSIAQQ